MTAISLILASTSAASAAVKPGDWAKYGLLPARGNAKLSVQSIAITAGPAERGMRWWRMEAVKPDGSTFEVRALSERVPMTGSDIGRIDRYMFKDGSRPFLEYRDKSTTTLRSSGTSLRSTSGRALLPKFDFRTQLLPCPIPGAPTEGAFITAGRYIGHAIQLEEAGVGKRFLRTTNIKVLALDPTLIMGTGRVFRDINDGRLAGELEYTYRPFTPEEYDEMEAAGINFFLADSAEREGWIRERAVFYNKLPTTADFPNIFHRSNYTGAVMFMDEPAWLTDFNPCKRLTDASNLLRLRVADTYGGRDSYGSHRLASHLEYNGICLGTWDLVEWDIPAWETVYQTAYYQMEGGASGLVHEGRYRLSDYHAELRNLFGREIEVTAEEMFRLHYAFLRGAARCFGKTWGTSIYGQADPKLSPMAMSMAYDMGARYFWFWTSDHGHHMPYREQLDLTRQLRAYEKTHPRQPIDKLRSKAEIAIAFPEGYTYWSWSVWNSKGFSLDQKNEAGVRHRDVISTAMTEGLRLARQDVPFDFVIDGDPAKRAGYKQIIRVGLDGKIVR